MTGKIVFRASVKHQKMDKILNANEKRNTLSIYVEKKHDTEIVAAGNLNLNPMNDAMFEALVEELGVEFKEKTPMRVTIEHVEEETLDNYDDDDQVQTLDNDY